MTNVSDVKDFAGSVVRDPIDQLVPRPRPLGVRLAIAATVLAVAGAVAWSYGFGRVYPQPDCCGTAARSPMMVTTRDGTAVQLSVVVGNSSNTALRIDAADVELADAEVLDVGVVPSWGVDGGGRMPFEAVPFPAPLGARGEAMVVVTFVPTSCEFDAGRDIHPDWGEMTLDLDVVDNGLFPSFGRSYRLPGPLVDAGGEPLGIFPVGDQPQPSTSNPIVAACALLGR